VTRYRCPDATLADPGEVYTVDSFRAMIWWLHAERPMLLLGSDGTYRDATGRALLVPA